MKESARNRNVDIPDWAGRLEGLAGIICSKPLVALVADLQRRLVERLQERPQDDPVVTMRWILELLIEALRRAQKADRWLDLEEAAWVGRCSPETIRRRRCELEKGLWRKNGLNGKIEVHIEGVAQLIDAAVEDIERARDERRAA